MSLHVWSKALGHSTNRFEGRVELSCTSSGQREHLICCSLKVRKASPCMDSSGPSCKDQPRECIKVRTTLRHDHRQMQEIERNRKYRTSFSVLLGSSKCSKDPKLPAMQPSLPEAGPFEPERLMLLARGVYQVFSNKTWTKTCCILDSSPW